MILLLLLAPFVFNLSGLIDTYLTQLFGKDQEDGGIQSSTGTLMIIGGVVAFIFSIGVALFWYNEIFMVSGYVLLCLLGSGIMFGLASVPYFEALKIDKIENILPMLQTIPLFTYLIANIVLGETMSLVSVVVMVLVVFVTGLFSRNVTTGKLHMRSLGLVLASAILYAASYVLFKVGGGEEVHLWAAYFWEHLGIAFFCLLFLFSHTIRSSTFSYFRNNGIWFSGLNIGNELLFIIGILITNYLSLQYPVAFVSTIVNGSQPLLGFLMVYIAYKTLPSVFARDYSRKEIIWKIGLCIISFLLIYVFYSIK